MTTGTKTVRTVCPAHCGIDACGILAHVAGDRVIKVEPAEFPDPRYRRICLRGLSSLDVTYHPDRLRYPMKRVGQRGEGKFERISWDEALDTIAAKFKEIGAKYGWPAIGWVLGGPGAGTTKFGAYLRLASLTQSTRVSAWGYGDAGLPCGSRVIFGSQFPYSFLFGHLLAGTADPDINVVWGSNPGESQPLNLMRPIMDAKEKGALLVVIDPRFTVKASKADQYIGVKPGTDAALGLGLLQVIFAKGMQNDAIIADRPYPVKAVWFSFINFLNQCANSRRIAAEMFPKLDFIVDTELFMTPNARYADIVLPVCSYLEFSDLIPHPYPYVQLQQKVIEPLYESRSDVDIAAGLAERLGFGEYFAGGQDGFIDLILDSKNDSLKGITRERLKEGAMRLGFVPQLEQEFDIPFSTASGKIEIYSENLLEEGQALPVFLEPFETPLKPETGKYPLAFIQGHSRFRTHSMFANVSSLLAMNPEPVVEINPQDAAVRNIRSDDVVTVFNDRARTTLKARLTEGVGPGVVNICQGWWIDQFREGSVNHLTHDVINPVQEKIYEPNMHMNDVAVEVVRSEDSKGLRLRTED